MHQRLAKFPNFVKERRRMIDEQIERRGLCEPRLLAAFGSVPRHLFVPKEFRHMAYEDHPLPIGFGQTISQPYIVALMTCLLELKGGERVLEVGTGSGYQSAILAKLAGEVFTIEFVPELALQADHLLRELGFNNAHVRAGDGSVGWPEAAPYDAVVVTAAAPKVPKPLLRQLADGGRLVLPVGEQHDLQILEVITRSGEDFPQRSVVGVAFVPLRGQYGWLED